MSKYDEDKKWWDERHLKRCKDFLRALKELQELHKCEIDLDSVMFIRYEDPFTPDVLFQICPELIKEYLSKK